VNAKAGAARLGQQAARQQRAQAGQRGKAQRRGGLARAPGQRRQQRGARERDGAAARQRGGRVAPRSQLAGRLQQRQAQRGVPGAGARGLRSL